MFLTTYQNAHQFLAKVRSVLDKNEALNAPTLGIALHLAEQPGYAEAQPYLATVEDAQGLVATACMEPSDKLVLTCERTDAREACELLAQDLLSNQWPLPRVLGTAAIARTFVETWQRLAFQSYTLAIRMRLFVLNEVLPPRPGPGRLRLATLDDLEYTARWTRAFMEEALRRGYEDPAESRSWTENGIARQEVFLWELEDGQVVSMAVRQRPLRTSISITAVYTPPAHRGHGYASRCVAALSQLLLDGGWHSCSLFTDLTNPISNSIYQQMGYRPVCDFDEYNLASQQSTQ